MLKWVAGLCAAMYVTLLVFGEPPEGDAEIAISEDVAADQTEAAPEPAPQSEPVEDQVPQETAATTPATEPDPAPEPTVTQTITPQIVTESLDPELASDDAPVEIAAATPEPELSSEPSTEINQEQEPPANDSGIGEIWRVTGSTVNLRAGASTQTAVLGRTQRGDSAEVIELLENGWAKVYILESGIEAYMAGRFLERTTQ